MRRVVVTGLGIVSCLGNNKEEVLASLQAQRSGIRFSQEYADLGLRSQVSGKPDIDLTELIDRKLKRFMGEGSAYAYLTMVEAVNKSAILADLRRKPIY